MSFAGLCARARNGYRARVEIYFVPLQQTDFTAPASGENQEVNDLAEVCIHVTGVPHLHKFGVTQNSVSASVDSLKRVISRGHRISLAQTFTDAPNKQT